MQCRPLQWEDKMEYVSAQNFMRCASNQCINNYQIPYWTNAILVSFEAKKSINLISKSGFLILHALNQ